jgi:hypothetical protein
MSNGLDNSSAAILLKSKNVTLVAPFGASAGGSTLPVIPV